MKIRMVIEIDPSLSSNISSLATWFVFTVSTDMFSIPYPKIMNVFGLTHIRVGGWVDGGLARIAGKGLFYPLGLKLSADTF